MQEKYTLLVRGERVEVSREAYEAYYKEYEHERYLADVAKDMERSLDRFAEDGVSVEYRYAMSRPSLEDQVERDQMRKDLTAALGTLSAYERMLVDELVIDRKSEREVALQSGIPQRTLNDHKRKVMNKLKTLLEK